MSKVVLAFGDIETTGLKQEDGHRIIEIAIGVWRYDAAAGIKQKVGKTWVQRINPERPIDPGAEAVHGISLSDLRGAPTWKEVAPKVHKILSATNIFVAHNGEGFDAPFIALELIRLGYKLPNFKVYDTMLNGRAATGFGKLPNLGELCWSMGVDYDPDNAHAADYDVEVMERSFWNGVDRGLFTNPVDFYNG